MNDLTHEPVDILAVGAHPDDVEIGCGATLVAMARRGASFGILDLTRGEASTRGTPAVRAREAAAAGGLLGARFRETLDLGDGGLREGRASELAVVEVIRRRRPRVVLAPLPRDRHPDHERAGRLVADAAYYAGLRAIETGTAAHRPQQVVGYPMSFLAEPSFVVDVTGVFETKLDAIRAHASQFFDPASTEPETFISTKAFLEGVRAIARAYGRLASVEYAEGFVTRRPPRVDDLVGAFAGFEPAFARKSP